MYKKLQQYYIIKTTSTRLKNSNYKIDLTLTQARENGEVVSVGESQLIRSLFYLQGKIKNKEAVDSLFTEKKKLKSRRSNKTNSDKLLAIESEIDKHLFVPEIVSVIIDNNSQYDHMIKKGFLINGRRFVRLLCGSGQSRRNTVFFVDSDWEESLKELLNNGRNENIPIAPAKFNAYFALCSSATLEVRQPYFCVIPDCEVVRTETVEFVKEYDDGDNVVLKTMELPFNLFDGQGIISPRLAQEWSNDLGLDYIPSTFVIRNSFLKGMVCVIDFHSFSDEIGKHLVKDAWGNDVNIRDMDLVLTTSQFKLWDSYDSCDDYIQKCLQNRLTWGVSKYSPSEDNHYVFSNYQFLQVLNLTDSQIESLCSRTIEYFNKSIGVDSNYSLLYLLGKSVGKDFNADLFNKTSDSITKAIMLDKKVLQDPYIYNHIIRSLNKRIKESYIGNLLLNGNYQTMISDPYAFMEHLFGLPVKGLLTKGQHYSSYWNKKGRKDVTAFRAPLTWRSEVNILNLVDNSETSKWYKYLTSGIIYNVHGYDCMLHADADSDGDLVMTTDQPEFLESAMGGVPITYLKNKVPKEVIKEESLYESDKKAFNTKIGFITNCSTTMYAMLESDDYSNVEKSEITKRLKICRKEQGNQIDKSKGLIVKPFPPSWTRRAIRGINESEENKIKHDLSDRIIISKRPYFMRWLYSNYNKDYKKYKSAKNTFCLANFGCSLEDFLAKDPASYDEYEKSFYSVCNRHNPLLDTPCVMNKICHYMEKSVKEIRQDKSNKASEELINLYKDANLSVDDLHSKLDKMTVLHNNYRRHKQTLTRLADDGNEEKYKTLDQYNKAIRQESYKISSSMSELANLAIAVSYVGNGDKGFAWNIFGEGIVNNIMNASGSIIRIPFLNDGGDIEYLGSHYSLQDIEVGEHNDYTM
jgi:hypothetical protein